MRCAVRFCGNNNRNGNKNNWRYFHFPKHKEQLKKWIQFCERDIRNPTTACICNEHFTPEDFERNMQYELGFTRKNPTKLKPGSYPSIKAPRDKLLQNNAKNKCSNNRKDASTLSPHRFFKELDEAPNSNPPNTENGNLVEFEELEDVAESSSNLCQNYETIEYINDTEEYTDAQLTDEAHPVARLELEIVDPFNPQSNAEEHLEIIDSECDNYARHLEIEVSSLKRQVFFLKDERKKLIDEIQNLRATVRSCRLKHADSLENLNLSNSKATLSRHRVPIKKTVMLYTANIDTIRKLRKINESTE
ncbi:uncharacterized protein LOC115765939 isoform X1 [Drosophila novamexicana]|uniref:uncharacterized protein LOC115765939 isoform X1 n=1 Tax=Drosophila novamexicana TaxID=47314 RepID=UPI0011E6062F|nr:uncharacterized protein LOC115765939 isoform X1 [Drosophila novamexicana]